MIYILYQVYNPSAIILKGKSLWKLCFVLFCFSHRQKSDLNWYEAIFILEFSLSLNIYSFCCSNFNMLLESLLWLLCKYMVFALNYLSKIQNILNLKHPWTQGFWKISYEPILSCSFYRKVNWGTKAVVFL